MLWQPGPNMIEVCSGIIRRTRPRAGYGRSTAISDWSSHAPFSIILTHSPPFLNWSWRRISWCYTLLNSFNPIDNNVTSCINPRPILVYPIFLFNLHLSMCTSSSISRTLLSQPRRSSLNRQSSSSMRPGLPTLTMEMELTILRMSKDGGGAWGDSGSSPPDDSVSNHPYVQSLGTHKVAPETPAVAAFLLPTAVESSYLPPPTSSSPTMLWDSYRILFRFWACWYRRALFLSPVNPPPYNS